MHPKATIQTFIGTEIKEPVVINLWMKFCIVRTDSA
jgi:hypothetical protein